MPGPPSGMASCGRVGSLIGVMSPKSLAKVLRLVDTEIRLPLDGGARLSFQQSQQCLKNQIKQIIQYNKQKCAAKNSPKTSVLSFPHSPS
uniref:Uncharacterized protein n=1 Tax=Rhizophora mucronata TaxID=61149 RepID=A0A2P2JKH5_RHIMU